MYDDNQTLLDSKIMVEIHGVSAGLFEKVPFGIILHAMQNPKRRMLSQLSFKPRFVLVKLAPVLLFVLV